MNFLHIIQSRAARIAVGPSAVRGKGHSGVTKAARQHLKSVDLSQFGTRKVDVFRAMLDGQTEKLRLSLPKDAQMWGLARKILNIFLRDCAYTIYLANAYRLLDAEAFFEIPLDSITAAGLKQTVEGRCLPRWPGVKHLTAQLSDKFQNIAALEAERRDVARMHLDAYWWAYLRDGELHDKHLNAKGTRRLFSV